MIRDPSDGTVREAPKVEVGIPATKPVVKDSLTTPDTGIRQPTRTDAQQRLERSREWLKDYQEKQNARGSNEQELPQAGNSVEGQRATKPAAST